MLSWIDRLLQAAPLGISAGQVPAVPKDSVGRTALFNLLRSNLDMFSVCVDRCYDRDHRIATGSFQVRVVLVCRRCLPFYPRQRVGETQTDLETQRDSMRAQSPSLICACQRLAG